LGIGYRPDNGDNGFYGTLDDVSIYNRALSPNEVAQLYANINSGLLPGLVAYYPFEGSAVDATGNGDNGTLVGKAKYGPGVGGEGLVLDGGGSGVQLGNPTNLWLQNFSISSWVKRASVTVASYGSGGAGTIVGDSPGGYFLYMGSDGTLVFSQLGNYSYLAGPAIADTNWHLLTFTMTNGSAVFYVDGVARSSQTYNVTFTFTGNVGIGYRPDNEDNGFYGTLDDVRIYNRALSSNEVAQLYNTYEALTTSDLPSITSQPMGEVVNAYAQALFGVVANGAPSLKYQWLLNGTNLPNANLSTLIVSNVTPVNLGSYELQVANNYGSVTSSVANLYLHPYLEMPFSGEVIYWGETNILSVGAWGSNLSYQWYFNGVAISGATSSTYILSRIQFTNTGMYSVVVSSPYGSITNPPEQVIVKPANVSLKFSLEPDPPGQFVVNPAIVSPKLCPEVVIQGTVGYIYNIESTTDLSNTNSWVVQTNLTLTQPIEYWIDTSVDVHTDLHKFYQVLPGQ